MTNTGYPNRAGNSTGSAQHALPDRALVLCKDSASPIKQRMVECGISLVGAVVLSVRDNPSLDSVDAVMDALPLSIQELFVADIQYLLPPDQRSAASVLRLIKRLGTLGTRREMTTFARTCYSPEDLKRAEAM